ncbi:MAG: HAD family hydrolase, partial [Succinivibrio sp.]
KASFVEGRRDLTKDPSIPSILDSIEAVAFDLDGTLTDSIGNIIACTDYVFDRFGYARPEPEEIMATIGMKLEDSLRTVLPEEHKPEYLEFTASYREIYKDHPEFLIDNLFPGVVEVVSRLKARGLKIGYVSGRSTAGIRRTVEGTGLRDFCDGIAAGSEVPSKPDPAMMLLLARRMGVSPSKILGVGDAGMDIMMYHNAGSLALGVQTGVWSGDALLGLSPPPEALLPKFTDLGNYL